MMVTPQSGVVFRGHVMLIKQPGYPAVGRSQVIFGIMPVDFDAVRMGEGSEKI
jgi:hypothetical protein